MMNTFLAGVRKVYVRDHTEETETCPRCKHFGHTNSLRYFYISLDEAIWKCSGETCPYPFENFKFKNFANNTVYYYVKMGDKTSGQLSEIAEENFVGKIDDKNKDFSRFDEKVPATLHGCSAPQTNETKRKDFPKDMNGQKINNEQQNDSVSNNNDRDFDFDDVSADFFKTDSPEQSRSPFEIKTDFDLMDGFSYDDDQKQSISVEDQFDFNGLNDMLDGLINSSTTSRGLQEDRKCFNGEDFVHCYKSGRVNESFPTVNLEEKERLGEIKHIEMPRPKLIKCFKHMEDKLKIKEEVICKSGLELNEPSMEKNVITESLNIPNIKVERKKAQTKRPRKTKMPILRKTPTKKENINATLVSLINQKNDFKPLAFLKRLSSLDIKRASVQTVKGIVLPDAKRKETSVQRTIRLSFSMSESEEDLAADRKHKS